MNGVQTGSFLADCLPSRAKPNVAGAPMFAVYPLPENLKTSDHYCAQVNGQPLWVEQLEWSPDFPDVADWFTSAPQTSGKQTLAVMRFGAESTAKIRIECSEHIRTYSIHPQSRSIPASPKANVLEFAMSAPDYLYIKINELPELCVFADPLEKDPPSQNDPNVLWFGPGIHEPGEITVKDDQTIYLAPGAVVYGWLRGSARHVEIKGRGVLDGRYQRRLVRLDHCVDVLVEGVMLRNGKEWQNTLNECSNITYRNVKVVSFGQCGDGIDPVGSRNIIIENCFFRCTDDCMAIKSSRPHQEVHNIKIRGCVMVGYAFSDGVTIGFECRGPEIEGIRVWDCDIISSKNNSRVGGHSAFSVICDGAARVHNVVFENIRVESDIEHKLFELNVTDGKQYGDNPQGHIENIRFKNISCAVAKPIVLWGYDQQHRVRDVRFENCTVAGDKLTEMNSKLFRTNEFVDTVSFS